MNNVIATRKMSELLTVESVATLLGCTTSYIDCLNNAGLMPRSTKIGTRDYWLRSAVMDWIDADTNWRNCQN